jgi:hypothetical protein
MNLGSILLGRAPLFRIWHEDYRFANLDGLSGLPKLLLSPHGLTDVPTRKNQRPQWDKTSRHEQRGTSLLHPRQISSTIAAIAASGCSTRLDVLPHLEQMPLLYQAKPEDKLPPSGVVGCILSGYGIMFYLLDGFLEPTKSDSLDKGRPYPTKTSEHSTLIVNNSKHSSRCVE